MQPLPDEPGPLDAEVVFRTTPAVRSRVVRILSGPIRKRIGGPFDPPSWQVDTEHFHRLWIFRDVDGVFKVAGIQLKEKPILRDLVEAARRSLPEPTRASQRTR